jgi:two-component system, cell cycle sensor histidine kinase and response regulator CckA
MHNPIENDRYDLAQQRGAVVYACDLSGNITFLNHEGERLSGYSREEACRMNVAEVIDPELAGDIHEHILREARKRVGTVYDIDVIAKDGHRISLEVSTRVIYREGEGIEIQGIAVPSERNQLSRPIGLRCVDLAFSYGNMAEPVG